MDDNKKIYSHTMKRKMMKQKLLIKMGAAVLLFCTSLAYSQTNQGIEPVFEQENPNLVFVEGEDAVSTNFALEPILSYSSSGSRTLQLNRTSPLQSGAPFYAEYVLYLETPGEYELWYGGTPAGPKDEFSPSYSSPFRYIIDGGEPVEFYREDIAVVEQYTPSYYWCVTTHSLDQP